MLRSGATLAIERTRLAIGLPWLGRLLAFRTSPIVEVALANVIATSTAPPTGTSWGLRAPGTCVPGLIKIGTYYTLDGWEFWYWLRSGPSLTLSLRGERFRRIVLSTADPERWASEIVGTGRNG